MGFGKIFDKITTFIFGGNGINRKLKDVLKDKKISKPEKLNKIIDRVAEYLNNNLIKEAKFATYELHYESFVDKKGNKIEEKFNPLFLYEYENLKLYTVAILSNTIDKYFDFNDELIELTNARLNICKKQKNFNNTLSSFDDRKFYGTNGDYRKEIMHCVDDIIDDINLDFNKNKMIENNNELCK